MAVVDAANQTFAEPGASALSRSTAGEEEQLIALVVVAGLPGCGKTSFCRALLEHLKERQLELDSSLGAGGSVSWHHICYDSIETELRGKAGTFEPATWKAAREHAAEQVKQLLPQPGAGRCIVLLDDNMYYRSMRKQWYHFAREQRCVFRQVLLEVPMDVCLARNSAREQSSQVPDFSIRHMAEAFEWPPEGGNSWEAQEPVTTMLEACEASTASQVESFMRRFSGAGCQRFWVPLPTEDSLEGHGPEEQSSAHACDLALRKIVSQALAHVPKDRGQVKSVLAKRWGAQKTELVKQLAADVKGLGTSVLCVEDLIHDMEGVFLKSCVVDIQEQLAAQ